MSFSAVIETKHALLAVRRATAIVGKSPIPVLGFVKLAVKDGKVTVSGTNLDCWLESTFDAEEGSGVALVPGEALENGLSVLPSGSQASLNAEDGRLIMTSGRTRFDLPTLPPADWPLGTSPDKPAKLKLAAKKFVASCEHLRQAMSTEPTRYHLLGIHLDFNAQRMVATNGLVLGWEPGCWEFDGPPPSGCITIPGAILNPLKKLLEGIDDCELLIDRERQRFTIQTDLHSLTSKVIDGQFPDYPRVVPNGRAHVFRASKEDLEASLKRIAWFAADDKHRTIRLSFKDGELIMTVRKAEGGSSEDACAARCIEGPGIIEFALNAAQLAWAISTLPVSAAADFQIVDAGCAVSIVAEGDTDRKHLRLLMPVRI